MRIALTPPGWSDPQPSPRRSIRHPETCAGRVRWTVLRCLLELSPCHRLTQENVKIVRTVFLVQLRESRSCRRHRSSRQWTSHLSGTTQLSPSAHEEFGKAHDSDCAELVFEDLREELTMAFR